MCREVRAMMIKYLFMLICIFSLTSCCNFYEIKFKKKIYENHSYIICYVQGSPNSMRFIHDLDCTCQKGKVGF